VGALTSIPDIDEL